MKTNLIKSLIVSLAAIASIGQTATAKQSSPEAVKDHACIVAATNLAVQQGTDDTTDPELGYPTRGELLNVIKSFKEYVIKLDTDALYDVTTAVQKDHTCKAISAAPY
jgi:hypothetical protein